MVTTDNGAIDYRKRLRDRTKVSQQPVIPTTADAADTPYDPPQELGDVIAAADMPADHSNVSSPVVVLATVAGEPAAADRTPQAVREQAKAALTQLLTVSDEAYTAMMTEMSATDPILYAVVVDEINNARAIETKSHEPV